MKHPWCHAVLYLGKRVENRSWVPKHRGPILLHASLTMSTPYYEDSCERMRRIGVEPPRREDLAFGGIVGRCDFVDVIPRGSFADQAQKVADKWGVDVKWWMREYNRKLQNGLILQNVEVFPKLIPYLGELNLFEVDETKLVA
jgi:hypothetical protein